MQQRISYLVSITKSADSDYAATFHDLPGLITAGKDMEQLYAMVEEAVALHLIGIVEDGELLPVPSPLRVVSVALEEELKDTETEVVGFTFVNCLVTSSVEDKTKDVNTFITVQRELQIPTLSRL